MRAKQPFFQLQRMLGVVVCGSYSALVGAQSTEQTISLYPPVQVVGTPLEYRQFEKVEITGSSIIRKEQTQTLPVQIFTRAEIQKSGKGNIADYLQTLPVIFNSFNPAVLGLVQSGFSGGAIHGQQIGTLVLVNGKRLAGNGRQTSFGTDNGGVDLNALPLSAIDRVEILTDGASSIYGTDAQAGVINIITRIDRPGVEITVDHRMPDGQKGQSRRVDLSVGRGRLAHDGFSWYVSTDVQEQEELLGRDRTYAAAGRYLVQQDGKDYWVYGSSLTAAQTSPTLATSRTAPWSRLWNADYQNGACPNNKVVAWGQSACLDNPYAEKGLYPASNSAKLHAQGQLMLTSDITAYAQLSWKKEEQRRSYIGWGAYNAKIGSTPESPGYNLAVANGFDPTKGVWLLYNGSELGQLSRWYALETRRLVAGVKGNLYEWDFNTNYHFSDNRGSFSNQIFSAFPNLGVDSNRVLTNAALLSPLSDSPALIAQMQGMVRPKMIVNEGTNTQQGIDFKASRSIGEIDGRDILFALGTDWRQEVAQFDRYSTGVPSYLGRRSVWAQFAEIQLPLPKAVEILASLRNDHYSDFGNTAHGKLGAKWVPHEQWLLRGAWSTGFRAPAVAQMQETGKTAVSTVSCTSGVLNVAAQLGGVCQSTGFAYVYSQGSADLKPELSSHWNLGMRFSPERNHTFSLDYWQINMRNKINNNYDFIIENPSRYISNFQLNTKNELEIFAPMRNLGKTQTSGIDFAWSLRKPTNWGQVLVGVNGTRLLTSKFQRSYDEPFESDLNKYSSSTGNVIPKIRAQWHAGLHQGNWQGHLKVNYMGSYNTGAYNAIQANTGDSIELDNLRVPAWWTVDLMVMHQWSPQTNLRLGIENVLNRKAPMDFVAFQTSFNFGTNPYLANVWGRIAHISLTHRF